MKVSRFRTSCVLSLVAAAAPLGAQAPPSPTATAEVVVSATKLPEDAVDIAGSTTVITGEELRSRSAESGLGVGRDMHLDT